jgi:hypothetical protein
VALTAAVTALLAVVHLIDYRPMHETSGDARRRRAVRRVQFPLPATILIAIAHGIFVKDPPLGSSGAIALSALINATMPGRWGWLTHRSEEGWIGRFAWLQALAMPPLIAASFQFPRADLLLAGLLALSWLSLPEISGVVAGFKAWSEPLLYHPARVLVITFLGLSIVGSLLLMLPVWTTQGVIAPVDAIFTAVSAVCVTGLIVLDTPNDLTLFGQALGSPVVRCDQHRHYQSERDQRLPRKGNDDAADAGRGDHEPHRIQRETLPQNGQHQIHPCTTADELGHHAEKGVDRLDLAQAKNRQGHRGIQVRAGLLSPGGIDESHRGKPHRQPHAARRIIGSTSAA